MKKTYVKPQLWTEVFQPADAIAGSCTFEVGFGDNNSFGVATSNCTVNYVFVGDPTSPCEYPWTDTSTPNDKPCYHASVAEAGYFGS